MTSVDPTYIKERSEHLRDRRRSQSAAGEGVVLAMDEVVHVGPAAVPPWTSDLSISKCMLDRFPTRHRL